MIELQIHAYKKKDNNPVIDSHVNFNPTKPRKLGNKYPRLEPTIRNVPVKHRKASPRVR